jgi:hypothetical protein
MTRTIEVYDRETGERITKRYFETDKECYDWFHDNYDETDYRYEKIG